jgi:hypothetical protein
LDDDDDDDDDVEIDMVWESIKENTKALDTESLGYCELKQHKQYFDEKCSKLLGKRQQAKLQWLQNPSQINGDNLNNVRS